MRTFKFQLRPTVGQAQALNEMLRDHCSLYNGALEDRKGAYKHRGVTVTYGQQSAQLKEIRAFDPQRQGRWSFSSQQATLRRLDTAMAAFFRRMRNGEKPGYPRFKPVARFDTVTFPKDGDGCRWDSQPGHTAFPRKKASDRTHRHQAAAEKVRALHAKVRRQRLDFHHKTALDLVRAHDVIAHEDLSIANMVRAPKPKPDPDIPGGFLLNGSAAKAGLNRSINDAAWGGFLSIVTAKARC